MSSTDYSLLDADSDDIGLIVEFLTKRHPDVGDIGVDDDIIEKRILDSVAFVEFLLLLEEITGDPVDPVQIDVENFRTLRRIDATFLSVSRQA